MSFDLSKYAGAGRQDIDQSVLGLPFLQIIQKGSPEFDESHKDHASKAVKDCRPGDILATRERVVLPQPLEVIPVATASLYTQWRPRSQGGGFVGNQPLSIVSSKAYRKGQANTKEANKEWLGDDELKFTVYYSVLYRVGEEWKKGLLSFTSTQLKKARRWSKAILGARYDNMPDVEPPIFGAIWQLTTENESNDEGGWKGWNIKLVRMLDKPEDAPLLEQANKAHSEEAPRIGGGTQVAALKQGSDDDGDDEDVGF